MGLKILPNHIRKNLTDGIQSASDCAWEFLQLERLQPDEKIEAQYILISLKGLFGRAKHLADTVGARPDFIIPPAMPPGGFAWPKNRSEQIRLREKISKLKEALDELESS